MSKTWRVRPSEIYAITGEFRAYCFDNAVMTFGLALEDALDRVEAKTAKQVESKRKQVLMRWLGVDEGKRFRNPPSM